MSKKAFPDDIINQLNESEWKRMGQEERLALLQKFENSLAAFSGRDACQIRVIPEEMLKEEEDLNGFYSRKEHCIYVHPNYLNSQMSIPGVSTFHFGAALTLIAHEGRHAWQHYVVEHPEKNLISRKERLALMMNQTGYLDGVHSSHLVYASQLLEYDARHFASDVLKRISQELEKKDGHTCHSIHRAIRENENREKLYAALIINFLDEKELKAYEVELRRRLAVRYPGVDFSDVSMFEAATRLLHTQNVQEFVDAPAIPIIGRKLFSDNPDKTEIVHKGPELKEKGTEIGLKQHKKLDSFDNGFI